MRSDRKGAVVTREVRYEDSETRLAGHKIGTGIPVLAELFAGIEYSATRDANMDVLNRNVGLFRQWPFTTDAAREYGRLYANGTSFGSCLSGMSTRRASEGQRFPSLARRVNIPCYAKVSAIGLYALLRRNGRTVQTVDLMIAAIALALGGCTVVTSDSDLPAVPGLNVENWATDA